MAAGARLTRTLLAAVCATCLAVQRSALAADAQGAQIAAVCASCHPLDGRNTGIPPLAGLDEAKIAQAMLAYRSGERTSQTMHVVAAALSPAEIARVARYLAALRPSVERP